MTSHAAALEPYPADEETLLGTLLFGRAARALEATSIIRDRDFEHVVLRRVYQAVRDSLEANGGVAELTNVVSEVRAELNGSSPPVSWYARLAETTPADLDPVPLAQELARRACDREERDVAGITLGDADLVLRVAREIEQIRERRHELESTAAPAAPASKDLSRLLEDPDPATPEELVERLISRPSVTIVYGASGSGKSYALMAALLDLIGGGGTFCGAEGLQIRPRSTRYGEDPDVVLWVYGSEDPERRIRTRARELWCSGPHQEKEVPGGRFHVATPPGLCLGSLEGLRWLDHEIGTTRASIVVLDTVQSLTAATLDTSDGGQVSRWLGELHRLRDKLGLVIIPVCHTSKTPTDAKSPRTKADSLLGSQAWRALSDGLVMLDAPDGDASRGTIRLIKGKDIDDPISPTRIGMDGETKRFSPVEDEDGHEEPSRGRRDARSSRMGRPTSVRIEDVLALRQAHPDGFQWTTAHKLLGCGRSSWHRQRSHVQSDLLKLGHVVVEGVLRWAK